MRDILTSHSLVKDPGHIQCIKELTNDEYDWLGHLPYYINIPEHKAIVVHAALVEGVPLESQDPHVMYNARNVEELGPASPHGNFFT